jgi:hypothetical protein
LQTADPFVDVADADCLRREIARDLDDMEETEFRIPCARDPRTEFHKVLVLELPKGKEHAIALELDPVFRRREKVPHLGAGFDGRRCLREDAT